MADDDWKKRVGIKINFSSESSEDEGQVTHLYCHKLCQLVLTLLPLCKEVHCCIIDVTVSMHLVTPIQISVSHGACERRFRIDSFFFLGSNLQFILLG